jgi:hypothetical protein
MTLGKLKYWIFLVIVVIAVFSLYERDTVIDYVLRNTEVSESELARFSKIFQREYIGLVERRIDERFQPNFQFYSEKPYNTQIVKSQAKGIGLIFVSSDSPGYTYRTTPLEIEADIFPCRILSEEQRSLKVLETVLVCATNSSCYVVRTPYITVDSIEFLTSGKEWLEVIDSGSITTKNIVVDKVPYSHLIKIKASKLRKAWTRDEAEREAQKLYMTEFWSLFNALEGFREYIAYPELEEMATSIQENQRYNPNYTLLDFDQDFERFVLTAIRKYGVQDAFVERIYSYVKERGTLRKKLFVFHYTSNWYYTLISSVTIVLVSSFFLLLNSVLKRYSHSRFRRVLQELRRLKKPGDIFFPIVVFLLLNGQRPFNVSPLQVLIPLIVAIFCASITFYLGGRFQSYTEP